MSTMCPTAVAATLALTLTLGACGGNDEPYNEAVCEAQLRMLRAMTTPSDLPDMNRKIEAELATLEALAGEAESPEAGTYAAQVALVGLDLPEPDDPGYYNFAVFVLEPPNRTLGDWCDRRGY